ncbi:MAG: isochorismatase family protein [Ilumatobacteraceae bacterium]
MAEWTRPKFAVSPGTTALVVIDMQNDFIAQGAPYESPHGREMIDSLNTLIEACRERGIPIVFTTHAHRADGSDLGAVRHIHPLTADGHALKADTPGVQMYPKVDIGEGDYTIQKRRYSAFFATDLELLLRNLGVDTLIIAGVATNVCCESTTRDAYFRDFKVIFLADGNGTISLSDAGWGAFSADDVQRYTLTNIATFYGEVAPISEVLERVEQSTPGT